MSKLYKLVAKVGSESFILGTFTSFDNALKNAKLLSKPMSERQGNADSGELYLADAASDFNIFGPRGSISIYSIWGDTLIPSVLSFLSAREGISSPKVTIPMPVVPAQTTYSPPESPRDVYRASYAGERIHNAIINGKRLTFDVESYEDYVFEIDVMPDGALYAKNVSSSGGDLFIEDWEILEGTNPEALSAFLYVIDKEEVMKLAGTGDNIYHLVGLDHNRWIIYQLNDGTIVVNRSMFEL